jgi:hypothetical protein
MKKTSFLLALGLLLPTSLAFARGLEINADTTIEVRGQADTHKSEASTTVRGDVHAEDNNKDEADSSKEYSNASTTVHSQNKASSESHRSVVASFVQSLLSDADRDGGIGAEVRAVAKSQNDSASTTAMAITKVEGRSAFKSFLLGTDWKTVGMLRGELATTSANIARLEAVRAKATDASVKADLQVQIDALKSEQANVQTFVDAHANAFSLFGWFTKLFQ